MLVMVGAVPVLLDRNFTEGTTLKGLQWLGGDDYTASPPLPPGTVVDCELVRHFFKPTMARLIVFDLLSWGPKTVVAAQPFVARLRVSSVENVIVISVDIFLSPHI
jgi:hypothetical protein